MHTIKTKHICVAAGIFIFAIVATQSALAFSFSDLLHWNPLAPLAQKIQQFEQRILHRAPVAPSPVAPSPMPSMENQASPLPILKSVSDYEEQVINVVQSSAPSVVSIIVSKDLPVVEEYFINPFQDFGFDVPPGFGIPQYRQKGTQKQEIGGGSGFVISQNGLIVTNKHVVVDTGADYTVLFNNGTKVPAKVIGRGQSLDVAVLKVNADNLKPLPLGDSDALKLGQSVIAIGNALGEFQNTVSVGVVSGLSRTVTVENEVLKNIIQTDAAINAGNSGGPLLDLRGRVIGINTAMARGAQSIGFAIPINQLKKVIQQVLANGKITTAYLGVQYRLITSTIQKQNALPVDYGAWIASSGNSPAVVASSPAQKAGLVDGDIILSLDGKKITQDSPLSDMIQQHNPGDTVTLEVMRQGKIMEFKAVLGER